MHGYIIDPRKVEMKTLILVHHGAPHDDGTLSQVGRDEILALAARLQPHASDSVIVISSEFSAALASQELLVNAFGAQSRVKPGLTVGDGYTFNLDDAYQAIRSVRGYGVVIVVTHDSNVRDLPNYLALQEEWGGVSYGQYPLKSGEAVVIDYQSRAVEVVTKTAGD